MDTSCTTIFVRVCCAKNRDLLVAPASKAVQMADYFKLSRVICMIKTSITLHNQISMAFSYLY